MVHGDKEGEGTYVCEVTNRMGKGGSSLVHVRVLRPPKIIEWGKRLSSDDDTNNILVCTGTSLSTMNVKWDKDGQEISPYGNQTDLIGNVTVEFNILNEEMDAGNGQHTLISVLLLPQNFTQELDGEYRCTISNLAGNSSAIIKLYSQGEIY